MQSKVVKSLALAMLLSVVGMIAAQQPGGLSGSPGRPTKQKQKAPPEKSKLEGMLAEALKNNPDIRVAAAKLAEADAELNRSRLQVMQKVVSLHAALASQKAEVAYQQAQYERYKGLAADRAVGPDLLGEAEKKLTVAKAKLEELEAQLPALLGKSPQAETAQRKALDTVVLYHRELMMLREERKQQHNSTGAMTERLRKALQTPVKVDYKDKTFDEILKDLAKKVPGLSFRNLFENPLPDANTYRLRFEEELPVSAILQALADQTGCLFFVREYGILATQKDNAPPRAMTVEDFMRQKPADESRPPSSGRKNAPESVEGVIKSVDKDGLLSISIGSDAGLAKGQTLELFWMPHKWPINDARGIGTVRIVEVEAHQSVVQPVGRLGRILQAGDRIIGQIQKK